MSGYLARLVDRAAGVPAATVRPRLGPLFPLGPAAPTEEPASFRDVTATPAAAGNLAPAAPLPRAESGVPRTVGVRAVPTAELARQPEPGGPERAARHQQVAAAAARAAVEQAPAVETGIEIVVPVPARSATAAVPDGENGNVATPVRSDALSEPAATQPASAVRPRATRADPRPRRAGEPHGATEQAPRIEVRIGRVEVRRPPEPEPVQWPAPVAQERVGSSFDRLAVARRYVDRRWS